MFWVGLLTGFFGAAAVALLIFLLTLDKWFVGFLREDRSDPDQPYYFMEISQGRSERLKTNKHVVLNVKRENYIQGGGRIDGNHIHTS